MSFEKQGVVIEGKEISIRNPDKVVGIGEAYLNAGDTSVVVTYSLGSCIGVSLYDPVSKAGGLAHFMLPLSRDNKEKARQRPFLYCDSGMSEMLQGIFELGAEKKRIIVKIAGGAQVLDINDTFRIGKKNSAVIKKFLWKNGLLIDSEDTGGEIARTMYLDMNSGRTFLRKQGKITEL